MFHAFITYTSLPYMMKILDQVLSINICISINSIYPYQLKYLISNTKPAIKISLNRMHMTLYSDLSFHVFHLLPAS